MPWHASLTLKYHLERSRTVVRFEHDGPLRVLQSLYPEGDGICHNVLVHPPGGLVGGDTLDIHAEVASGAHALVTTPGATRFYKSNGEQATQRTRVQVAAGARMEWLPLEAIAYNACDAVNRLQIDVAPGGECLGWDVSALGLPLAGQPFESGRLLQHTEVPGVWLERGVIDASDHRLLESPLGLAGQRSLAMLFFVAGEALAPERRERALDLARELIEQHELKDRAGATSPHPQVVVVRALAPVVEPVMHLMQQVWGAWRQHFWQQSAQRPRIWSM